VKSFVPSWLDFFLFKSQKLYFAVAILSGNVQPRHKRLLVLFVRKELLTFAGQ